MHPLLPNLPGHTYATCFAPVGSINLHDRFHQSPPLIAPVGNGLQLFHSLSIYTSWEIDSLSLSLRGQGRNIQGRSARKPAFRSRLPIPGNRSFRAIDHLLGCKVGHNITGQLRCPIQGIYKFQMYKSKKMDGLNLYFNFGWNNPLKSKPNQPI